MKTLVAQIVKERAGTLEGKWVALVSEEFLPPLPVPAGTDIINDVYASDLFGDPISGFEVLCSGDYAVYKVMRVSGVRTRSKRTDWYLVVSDQPFVATAYEYSGAPTNIKLVKAQQVSRGELGRYPDVPMPRFTRGAKGWSWVRLTDLADFLRSYSTELWDEYYQVGGRDVCNDSGMEVCLDGCGKDRQVVRVNAAREPFPYGEEQIALSRIWVPAGWASDVCYLAHFGTLNQQCLARLRQAPRAQVI